MVIAPAEGALVQQQMAEGTRPAEIDARAALQRGIAADQYGAVKIVNARHCHAHGPGLVKRPLQSPYIFSRGGAGEETKFGGIFLMHDDLFP